VSATSAYCVGVPPDPADRCHNSIVRLALVLPILLATLIAVGATFAAGENVRFPRGTATISTGERKVVLRVEVARTDAQRQQGLMNRRSLGRDAGMVFQFPRATSGAFWMKNTLIPLDMIFIRADGTIARIAANTTPGSLQPVPAGEPVVAVLELRGGRAAELGIRAGDRVEWPG
jgi:hypothetical protein